MINKIKDKTINLIVSFCINSFENERLYLNMKPQEHIIIKDINTEKLDRPNNGLK